MNATSMLGHNNPPRGSIVAAEASFQVLASYLASTAAIENDETAKSAGALINSTNSLLKDLDAERDSLVRPLNENVKKINSEFKAASEPLEKLLGELKSRLSVWLEKGDLDRQAELNAAKAELAAAREDLAQADIEEADAPDYGAAVIRTSMAVQRVKDAENRLREALTNDRARVEDENCRTLSRRSVETLLIEDAVAALIDILAHGSLPEKLSAAILTAARDFRKAHGELPAGVISHTIKKV